MNKIGKVAVGLAVGGFIANEAWMAMSSKTYGKALENMKIAENLKDKKLIKRVCEEDLEYSDLTEKEWKELRDLLDTMVKRYKKAYILMGITKFKRNAKSIVEIAILKADMKSAIDEVEEKIKELDEMIKENKQK